MPVLWVKAKVECEGCAKEFEVKVETGEDIPAGWDMIDIVKDAVRACDLMSDEPSSVQADMILCDKCTKHVDAALDDDAKPTAEQIGAILEKAYA